MRTGTYTLADNGSTNGTFVNGEQIVERVLLDGVDILFGQVGAVYSHPEIAELGFDEMEESRGGYRRWFCESTAGDEWTTRELPEHFRLSQRRK